MYVIVIVIMHIKIVKMKNEKFNLFEKNNIF